MPARNTDVVPSSRFDQRRTDVGVSTQLIGKHPTCCSRLGMGSRSAPPSDILGLRQDNQVADGDVGRAGEHEDDRVGHVFRA